MPEPRRVGPKAIALMHHFESCKLKAYRDMVGVWTIGWGDTGPHVRSGLVWTQAQADAAFENRLANEFAAGVDAALGSSPTTPAEFGAMVALAYNIGLGPRIWLPGRKRGFRQSSVLKFHKAGDHASAAAAFLAWNRAGGQVVAGLTRRRSAEAALYRSDFAGLSRFTQGAVS